MNSNNQSDLEATTSSKNILSEQQQQQQQTSLSSTEASISIISSNNSSPTASLSLIKLDELSSFGATKQSRLPALIKLNNFDSAVAAKTKQQPNSMPTFSASEIEKIPATASSASALGMANILDKQQQQQASLPAQVNMMDDDNSKQDKENKPNEEEIEDFQVVQMESSDLMGPSLPQPQQQASNSISEAEAQVFDAKNNQTNPLQLQSNQLINNNQQPSLLGDSLIDMIINLRNENQNLVRALETNNEYVKERLAEFKRVNEEAKKRESLFAMEKAEYEHQVRKLQRQNTVLSDRLKVMESKLKDMKLEVSDALVAANSSKTSSIRGENNMYPDLNEMQLNSSSSSSSSSSTTSSSGEFNGENNAISNTSRQEATTIQMDATNEELFNNSNNQGEEQQQIHSNSDIHNEATKVSNMSKEELSKRFDSEKAEFYAYEDPMKQCDKLEQQLNDIGKRDYEICLLQQQLNIYRQDYRLEKMANLEAKLQIEKLKNDIDRLCYDRLKSKTANVDVDVDEQTGVKQNYNYNHHHHHRKHSGGVRFDSAAETANAVISKLGTRLSKKAARTAAKAAKYAAKQAYREEKVATKIAATAAAAAAATPSTSAGAGEKQGIDSNTDYNDYNQQHHHHHRSGRHHRHHRTRGVGSEVVNDLLSTANKAMLTGYKMASTHVNLALDKLSQYEQAQASQLAQARTASGASATGTSAGAAGASFSSSDNKHQPSAPPASGIYPSVD